MTVIVNELSLPSEGLSRSEQVFEIRDDAIGLLAFLSLIRGKKGPAFGGIRRRRFAAPEDALQEARELAGQMNDKITFAGLPNGAAKVVIVDSVGLDLEKIYRSLGQAIESMAGQYFSGPDVGTGVVELSWVAEETRFVNHVKNNPGPSTALGVAAGLAAAVHHLAWDDALRGKTVLIQGLGSVGKSLAFILSDKGAKLLLYDLDADRTTTVTQAILAQGGQAQGVTSAEFETQSADVFCPCALGDVLDSKSSRFKVICGSANLQTSNSELADQLFAEGCLFIPEAAVNAGAVLEGILVESEKDEERGRELARAHIMATESRVMELLDKSSSMGVSPNHCLELWLGEMKS
ncbi:MAG: leucine dehydrogenase [Planctomycetota bacterium]|jgi:leucine dehydrogenase